MAQIIATHFIAASIGASIGSVVAALFLINQGK